MRFSLPGLLASLLLALPAAAQTQLTMNDLMAVPLKVHGADCALFPAAALLDTLSLPEESTRHRFTPTRQQVEIAENQLNAKGIGVIRPSFSAYDSANLAYIQKHLANYKRQYFGFYNSQRQACLFIQLFEGNFADWLYQHLLILDGGPSVWEVYYNLDTQQYYGLGYHSQG